MFCSAQLLCSILLCSVLFCSVLLHLATLRVGLWRLCQHVAFSLARDALAWVYVVIYFAQIVMLRLRKISPNCAQIVLENKKNHTFFTRKIEIFIRKSRCFWKKKWKNSGKKKISVENNVFFPIKFSLPKNLFSSQLSTMDNSTCPKSPH